MVGNTAFEWDRTMEIRAKNCAVVDRLKFLFAAFPAEQPSLADPVAIHVFQKPVQIVTPPVRMIVSVYNFHDG